MNTKKYILAVLAGFIGNTVTYAILEVFLLKTYIAETIIEPSGAFVGGTPIMAFVAVLSMSLIMAYIYPTGYKGGTPLSEGFRFGVLLGLFVAIPYGIFFDLMFPIGFIPTLVLILVYTLEVAASGLLIGLVYGKE